MMRQAKRRPSKGQFFTLRTTTAARDDANAGQRLWHPEPCWDPTSANWWSYEEYLDENR